MKVFDFTKGDQLDLKEILENRAPTSYEAYERAVAEIVIDIRQNGMQALLEYTEKYDGPSLTAETVKVSQEEITQAYEALDENLIRVLKRAKERIWTYHAKQKQYSWFDTESDGSIMGQQVTALERVGVYVPGGKAVYPSSVLMDIIPAQVAGVDEIVVTTPPDKEGKVNPMTLVAADICGVSNIYKVGGAQAIAALAFGVEGLGKVDKIVGPGNIYVALAKKAVYGHVSIDSIAGPSEVLVIADESASPGYVAADLMSQAEHDELASAVLITTSPQMVDDVLWEIERQKSTLKKKHIIEKSLENYGLAIIVGSIDEAVAISNEIAPEHLEICTRRPFDVLPMIRNAGAIFLGDYSPEPLGDYMAGPNHVLPTNGTAKFFSPLSVDDFIKKSSIIAFNKRGLEGLKDDVMTFAEAEGLTAHANAIKVRFEP